MHALRISWEYLEETSRRFMREIRAVGDQAVALNVASLGSITDKAKAGKLTKYVTSSMLAGIFSNYLNQERQRLE